MKLNWNSLGERGCKTKTFCGGSMDIFWNYTIIIIYIVLFTDYSSSRTIEDLLNKWGLQGIEIPLEEFNADQGNAGGSNLSDLHTIHMLEITIKQSLHKGNVPELYQDNS